MKTNGKCAWPEYVQWRERPRRKYHGRWKEYGVAPAKPQPRAAVCLAGVPRFLEKTAKLMRLNFFARLGMDWALFAYATATRAQVCPGYRVELPERPNRSELHDLFEQVEIKKSPMADEWQVLVGFLEEAAAVRVAWRNFIMDELPNGGPWERQLLCDGNWMGGAIADGVSRPGSGLLAVYDLSWCSDEIKWHEDNVLGSKFDWVLFSRWDLMWLVPFPALSTLSLLSADAVWVPGILNDFGAAVNDRLAAVPRQHLDVYFGRWHLMRSGDATSIAEEHIPGCGIPAYDHEKLSAEVFLWARLKSAGVTVFHLPPTAYTYCDPQRSPRTRTWPSCTSIEHYVVSDEWGPTPPAAKYVEEYLSVQQTLEIFDVGWPGKLEMSLSGGLSESPLASRIRYAHNINDTSAWNDKKWTGESISQAVEFASFTEIYRGEKCQTVASQAEKPSYCRGFFLRVLAATAWRPDLHVVAVKLARIRVVARPDFLESWIWLAKVLSNPAAGTPSQVAAAVAHATELNRTHPALLALSVATSAIDVESALGGVNMTRCMYSVRQRGVLLRRRRRMRQAALQDAQNPAARAWAWLNMARFFLKDKWVAAAKGAIIALQAEEFPDPKYDVVKGVDVLEAEIRRLIKLKYSPRTLGAYENAAPSPDRLLSRTWLEDQERRVSRGGLDTWARNQLNLVLRWDTASQNMVPSF